MLYEVITGDVYSYPYYFCLAILCGVTALLYFKLSDVFALFINEKLKVTNPFARLIPVTFIFGITLLVFPELYGIGYENINSVLNGRLEYSTAAALLGLIV